MDLEQYTDTAKETMIEAMEIARALDHQTITTAHVIKAILLNNKKRFRKLIELVQETNYTLYTKILRRNKCLRCSFIFTAIWNSKIK